MNRSLLDRELGIERPNVLKTQEITRRVYALDLSRTKSVATLHDGPVNCLDIENVEGRYMLSGGSDTSIHLYDLEERPIQSTAEVPRNSHIYGVSGVSWYPFDTGMFLSSSFDHTIKVWDTNTMQ
ncbi:hypothetical protein BC937DRAFT_87220, partial [Endogone sp. FLAS-F59071]